MPFPAGSYEDVRAWAESEFPGYFAAVTTTVNDDLFQTNKLDGEFTNGKIHLQPMLVRMLGVALTASDGVPVHARIVGDDEVELVRHSSIKDPKDGNKTLWYIKPVTEITELDLYEPFRHVIEAGHPAAVDRLEVLIRFFYLKCGDKNAVSSKLGFFETHFRAACRDVARATGAVDEADDMEDTDTLPDETPDLIADTDTASLSDNPVATSIFNNSVYAMDESYHDFKTTMLRQLGAMQEIDREKMAQLQATNQELERRFDLAEEARKRSDREFEVEKAKTKAAIEDAARWKAQYEGLKETLQGALGQRY